MSKSSPIIHRFIVCLLSAFGLLLALPRLSLAQRAMPDPALLPSFNPLCDGNLVPCLQVDDFAGHAYAHLLVLPRTDLRDTAAVVPLGIALGLFGRVAGGVSTHYAFWKEGEAVFQQFGPLRLNLTVRLLPIFPLASSGGSTKNSESRPPGYAPPRRLQLGLSYEHQVRVWKFEGANSLGLLTDLASLRLLASRMFGPVHVSASLGALYDWHGQFATGEVAAHLGLYLPGFQALKIYVEALGRGFPSYVQNDALLLGPDGRDLIHPQAEVGLGLSFHPHARVDLEVSVHRGFGGLAPWAVSVQFLTLSVGKTYQGRAAAPVAQLAAEVATEAVVALKDFIDNLPIDPTLDEDCQILDKDNVTILGQFGKRTKSGFYCEQDGFLVPIRHELNRDRKITKLCRDDKLKDCLLERHGKQWVPVHRPRLDSTCRMIDSDGLVLGYLGQPTADGKACRYGGEKDNGRYGKYTAFQQQPIGEFFFTDADRTAVCLDAAMQSCFMKPPAGRRTLAWSDDERAATMFVRGGIDRLGQRVEDSKSAVRAVEQTAKDVASGKVKLTTIYQEGKQTVEDAAQAGAELINDPAKRKATVEAVQEKVARLKHAAKIWMGKPPEQQVDDLASAAGGGAVDLGINALVGGTTRIAGEAAGLADTARRGKKAEEALKDVAKVEKKSAQAVQVAEGEAHRAAKTAATTTNNQAEQAARARAEAARRSRVQHMQPAPNADGAHTTFVRDPNTNKVYKYQEWDKDGMPVKRADAGSNSSHPNPHSHVPAGQDHMHHYAPPNRAPDGRLYPGSETGARNLEPHEIPK